MIQAQKYGRVKLPLQLVTRSLVMYISMDSYLLFSYLKAIWLKWSLTLLPFTDMSRHVRSEETPLHVMGHMQVTPCTIQWKWRLWDYESVTKLFCILHVLAIWLSEKCHNHMTLYINYIMWLACDLQWDLLRSLTLWHISKEKQVRGDGHDNNSYNWYH